MDNLLGYLTVIINFMLHLLCAEMKSYYVNLIPHEEMQRYWYVKPLSPGFYVTSRALLEPLSA